MVKNFMDCLLILNGVKKVKNIHLVGKVIESIVDHIQVFFFYY